MKGQEVARYLLFPMGLNSRKGLFFQPFYWYNNNDGLIPNITDFIVNSFNDIDM